MPKRLDMVIGQIWTNASWRAVTVPFRGLMEALRRARRERETYRELSRFSDCMLKDIGISRPEIGSIARAVAVAEAGMTIAELRSTKAPVRWLATSLRRKNTRLHVKKLSPTGKA